jgi:hypothetical protein
MDRKETLMAMIDEKSKSLLSPLIDTVVKMEIDLAEMEKLPFYKVNPNNPYQQKILPVFKAYKELMQQYTNNIKIIGRVVGVDDSDNESPLRKWVRNRVEGKNVDH